MTPEPGRTPAQRWREHTYNASKRPKGNALYSAILKYGRRSFQLELLCSFQSWEDACALEPILIAQWNTLAPHGYNVMEGGNGRSKGFRPSPESIERSASKHRGRKRSPEAIARSAAAVRGCRRSTETREKIAASKRGRGRSAETKTKLKAYWAQRRVAGEFKTESLYAHRGKASHA